LSRSPKCKCVSRRARVHDKGGFDLKLTDEPVMGAALDAEIKQLLCRCFPPDVEVFSKSRHWHGTAPAYTLTCQLGGRLAGHVGIVLRNVACGDRQLMTAGIQNLAVLPEWRGGGLAQCLMTESMAEANRRKVPFGLLFCVPGLERFYVNLGWNRRDVAVVMADSDGHSVPIPAKNICMVLSLAEESFPFGDIDLQGRDW
jgi:predicted N-acetyltransferase YhbS